MTTVMKLAAAKIPVTTEVIDRTSQARVGTDEVGLEVVSPRIITAGERTKILESALAAKEEKVETVNL